MPRYTRAEIQSLVVGQIISDLRGGSIADMDDCEFIAKATDFQRDLARQLEELYPHVTVAPRVRRACPHRFCPHPTDCRAECQNTMQKS